MGRRQQKERERKRAAAICQSLKPYLPPKKKTTQGNHDAVACLAGSESVSGTSTWVISALTQPNVRSESDGTATVDSLPERPSSVSAAVALLPPRSESPCCTPCSSREYRTGTDGEDLENCCLQTGQGCTPVDIGVFCRVLQGFADSNGSPEIQSVNKSQAASQRSFVSHTIPWRLQSFFSACVAVRAPLDGLQ